MNAMLSEDWIYRLSKLDYAFQPIVNIHNGRCYGYEALLRNHAAAGFDTIDSVFDLAYQENLLHQTDLFLREKAFKKFSQIINYQAEKLFFNLDSRILFTEDYQEGLTRRLMRKYSLQEDNITFEISEKHNVCRTESFVKTLSVYRNQGFRIAMDDFGSGFSGLQMLYFTEPDFIKIDRFFISGIEKDRKKKLFVSNIVEISHLLGINVIAEGVETDAEFFECRNVGCDLVQGYRVQYPETDLQLLKSVYMEIRSLSETDKRNRNNQDQVLLMPQIEYIEPTLNHAKIYHIFKRFTSELKHNFIPVIDNNGEPLGVIKEETLKKYAYAPYGKELLRNPAFGCELNRFITKFPLADIHASIENILKIYSNNENIEGILIIEDMKYVGFLSASALLKVINQKNLALARDQNPLTCLPGNSLIYEYVSNALEKTDVNYNLIYFDFDNFKPFNDTYGFRNGDRAILLFSDMLKKYAGKYNGFAGHIGGDDFFMGFKERPVEDVCKEIIEISKNFHKNVESFYDGKAIKDGYIYAKDREGRNQKFSIMTVSSVILTLPDNRDQIYATDILSQLLAKLKKISKKSAGSVCCANFIDLVKRQSDLMTSKTAIHPDTAENPAADKLYKHFTMNSYFIG
jgi:diguanylate cyclase (GGDEF)-like protein